MADDASAEDVPITFNVKSAQDAKHTVTLPMSSTVLQLKEKLSDSEYANIPTERQRLIYSGRVLKDADTLASYKIKEGHTIHLVKGAASNERQNPASQGNSSSSNATPAVPTNLSSGPGANNPLAGLTGARYAGLAHLPNQSMFGPDGGMGPPPDPEQILSLLENPQFASSVNEALSNPQVIETMIQQNPMLRDMGPEMRQMMQSPEFRRMMTDPQMLRSTMQMQRMMGGGMSPFGGRGNSAFPAPGATDTTPAGAQASPEGQGGAQGTPQAGGQQQAPMNPFAMFGAPGQQGANPFAALFNPAAMGAGAPGQGNAPQNSSANSTGTDPNQQQQQQQQPQNPFLARGQDPMMMAQLLSAMNANSQAQSQPASAAAGGDPATSPPNTNQQPAATNAFSALMQQLQSAYPGQANQGYMPWMGGMDFPGARSGEGPGGMGSGAGEGVPSNPVDTRPPEDRYAGQLRQLNDMGFYEFERNVEALRRSGGSVQGAVEYLLTH